MTRQEAIKWVTFDLESWEHQCLSYHPTKEALKMAIEALEQPERKKGKWERDENGDWHCSVCKAIVEQDEQINHYWQYCYHCGAKMEG